MFLAEKLHEQVFYYQEVIKDPQELIDLIEELDLDESTHAAIPAWGPWLSNSKDGVAFGGKKDFNLGALETLNSNRKKDVERAIFAIKKAVEDVAEAYYRDRGFDGKPNMSPFAGIMKYTPGCAMGAHFDAQAGDQTLKYSIVLYLNENYEGGEISFAIRDYDLRDPAYGHMKPLDDVHDPGNKDLIDFWLKPKAGSALIFPSTHPFMHRVHDMKAGDKYIFPGFVFIDGFEMGNPELREKYNAGSSKVANTPEEFKSK